MTTLPETILQFGSGRFLRAFADLFIHHSGMGPQPKTNLDGTPRRQVHSRRAHSYLVVFQKPKGGRA